MCKDPDPFSLQDYTINVQKTEFFLSNGCGVCTIVQDIFIFYFYATYQGVKLFMSIRSIVMYPDPMLRTMCTSIDTITDETIQLIDDMVETMHAANGIGLAAPQVGVCQRLFVVDVGEGVYEFINPQILHTAGTELGGDGCLSIPGISGESYRSFELTIRAQNRTGEWFELQTNGMFARCIQHEYDHLNGVLFIDKVMRLYEDRDEDAAAAQSEASKPSLINTIMQHAADYVTDDIKQLIREDYQRQATALQALLENEPAKSMFRFPNEWEVDREYLEDDLKFLNKIGGIKSKTNHKKNKAFKRS